MKSLLRSALLLAVLILGHSSSSGRLYAADNPPPSPANRIPPERAELKVLEVFAGQDGGHRFRAYRVEWKGQPVIASDSLAKTDYRVGDTISVLVMKHPHPDKTMPHDLMAFSVMPHRPR